jgi:Transposase DDE domain
MNVNELVEILNSYFGWNKARMTCFVSMLVALIKVRTVNLTELACGFPSSAKQDSRYKRIKRFFQGFKIDLMRSSAWVMSYFGLSEQAVQLSMDRTNWLWGKVNINILMLSVVYKGVAIPLLWKLLSKRGNSDTEERIELMKRFIAQFGKERIDCILADREFVGDEWFSWLLKEQISFCIRIKNNHVTTNSRGLEVNIDALFYDLRPGERRVIAQPRKLWKQTVYLSALRLSDGELLIVATDKLLAKSIELYARRWEIETLFSCLKGRGFNFEDTHMTQINRIEKLLVLLTVAFSWAHKTGEWRHEQKPIKIKKHGRLAMSYFRYGLDLLRDIALNGTKYIQNFFQTILSFQPTPHFERDS